MILTEDQMGLLADVLIAAQQTPDYLSEYGHSLAENILAQIAEEYDPAEAYEVVEVFN